MRRAVVAAAIGAMALLAACSAGVSDDVGRAPANHAPPPVSTPTGAAATTGSLTAPAAQPSVAAHTAPNPCRHNRHGRQVVVSLPAQHLWMCRATHVAHGTAITSGMVGRYTHTPTGHYRIQALDRNQVLTLVDGQQYTVKYWIPFDAPLFGFHDSSWQTFPYGSDTYRRHGSHGCVHMPLHAIATLYHWAHVGTRVAISR